MKGWTMTALGVVMSVTLGVGLAAAHGNTPKPTDAAVMAKPLPETDAGSWSDAYETEVEGALEVMHEDREDGSGVYRHSVSTHEGQRLSLEGVQHPDLVTGDRIRVRGVRYGDKLRLQATAVPKELTSGDAGERALQGRSPQALEVLQYAPLPNTFGAQKTAVFLVNFADNPSYRPFSNSYLKTFLNEQVVPFFRENSYEQTWLDVDVFGWYTMPFVNSGCPRTSIQTYAEQAAVAAGVNLSAYPRRIYVVYPGMACGWYGVGTVGGNPSRAWINGNLDAYSFVHEFGHNLGLYHSHSMSCGLDVLGPNCIYEYGDGTDVMGGGGHFNPFQKQRIGWLDYNVSPPIAKVQQSAEYMIEAYDLPGTKPKALKVQRGATAQAFFVSMHRGVGFDMVRGVFVHMATDGAANSSYLLNMTPDNPWDYMELPVGKSFTDPDSGITIRTVSIGDTSATIQVDMGGPGPSCTRSAPSVTASPAQSPAVQPGSAVTYTVSVTNTDSAGCSASTFTLQATAPTTSWQKSFGASSITTNPGATGSTTLRITSPSVATGSYAIVSAATRTTAAPLSGSGSAFYNVAPPCTRSAPSVIGSPAESPAVQAGTMVTYNVSVTNTDSAGCSASTFTLQATAPTPSWQKSFGASSVTTGPGATVSTTLRITSPSVPTGSYTIVSAATRTSASPLSGSGSVLYNVGPDGPPPPPPPPGDVTLTITTNSPIGREMTFGGTLTGSTSLSATIDGIAHCGEIHRGRQDTRRRGRSRSRACSRGRTRSRSHRARLPCPGRSRC